MTIPFLARDMTALVKSLAGVVRRRFPNAKIAYVVVLVHPGQDEPFFVMRGPRKTLVRALKAVRQRLQSEYFKDRKDPLQ